MEKKTNHHSPTLRTIKMVESTLKNMDESLITVAGLKRILPKKVNHNTLIEILDYLHKGRKIDFDVHGIVWIENNSPKMQAALRKAINYDKLIAEIDAKLRLRNAELLKTNEKSKR